MLRVTQLRIFKDISFYVVMTIALSLCSYLAFKNPNIGADAIAYLIPAYNLLHGNGYTIGGEANIFNSPLYGLLAGLLNFFIDDIEYSGMAIVCLSYLGIVALSYYLGRSIIDKRAAIFSAVFVALCPALAMRSYINLPDIIFAFFLLCSFAIVIKMWFQGVEIHRSISLGIFLGLACLTRPDTVLLCPVLSFLVFLRGVTSGHSDNMRPMSRSDAAKRALLVVIAFLVIVSPYVLYLHNETGNWTVSNKIGFALLGGGQEHPQLTMEMAQNAERILLQDIAATINRIAHNAFLLFHKSLLLNLHIIVPLGTLWILYPLSTRPGMLGLLRQYRLLPVFGIGAIFCLPLIPGLLIYPYARYILPYFIVLQILCGCLATCLLEGYEKSSKPIVANVLIFLVVISSVFGPLLPKPAILKNAPNIFSVMKTPNGHLGLREAGLWLQNNVTDVAAIRLASRKGTVPLFYANGKKEPQGFYVGFPKDINELREWLHVHDINYVVFDSFYIPEMPGYRQLWGDTSLASDYGLELIEYRHRLFQIYTVTDTE